MRAFLTIIFSVFLLASCGGSKDTPAQAPPPPPAPPAAPPPAAPPPPPAAPAWHADALREMKEVCAYSVGAGWASYQFCECYVSALSGKLTCQEFQTNYQKRVQVLNDMNGGGPVYTCANQSKISFEYGMSVSYQFSQYRLQTPCEGYPQQRQQNYQGGGCYPGDPYCGGWGYGY